MMTVRDVRHALYISNVQNKPLYIEIEGDLHIVEGVKQDADGDVVVIAHKVDTSIEGNSS